MSREITIVTPENIPLTLEPAGLARRFGALFLDMMIQGCILVVLGIIFLVLSGFGISIFGPKGMSGVGGYILAAIGILLVFLIFSGYHIFFELLWNGQTPGKRTFNLRVVRDNGSPVDIAAVATRNLVRIADMLPVSYAVGAMTMFFHPTYKRLGDIVAGTLVIKEHNVIYLPTFSRKMGKSAEKQGGNLPDGVLNPYYVLKPEELALLRQFASRRWQMTSDDSERLAYRLVAPLVPRLNITFLPGVPPRYADLASTLVLVADEQEVTDTP